MIDFEVIVTSGGTISRIDDVRHIGNFSEGTTGAAIAEELLRRGAVVHYVHNRRARRPFRGALAIEPSRPLEDELARVRAAAEEFRRYAARLHEHPIETFEEYLETVRRLLTTGRPDAIVLAAAVSDYGARPQEGKIGSDREGLTIELVRYPKVISLVKEWNPHVFLVGFKLLSGATLEELIETAYRHGARNRSNLTVANTISGRDFRQRVTALITPEKGVTPVSVAQLPARLADAVLRRASRRHYRTEVAASASWRKDLARDLARVRHDIGRCRRLNLFEPYWEGARAHFGFYALRVARGGFLITARASDKESLPDEDIVYVPEVDKAARVVHVRGEKKASLNANVAARIFVARPDVEVILHAHVFPGLAARTEVDFAPGTEEDAEETLRALAREGGGAAAIELVNHGLVALGRTLDEALAALEIEPAYTRFPDLYDTIYRRFRASDDFVRLVTDTVPRERAVLDLAGGTGDLALRLIARGYTDVSLADMNEPMLEVARRKLVDLARERGAIAGRGAELDPRAACFRADMRSLAPERRYDAVLVRQAIGYLLDRSGLAQGLRAIRAALLPGGVLLFNAPNHRPGREYPDRHVAYEADGFAVRVREMNAVEGAALVHTQQCWLVKLDGTAVRRVFDLNRFGLFTKEDFAEAAREAGFQSIAFLGKELKPWDEESRSLYAVARA